VLKQRIITAAVMVPVVLGAIFYLPTSGFALFMSVVVLIGAWEWSDLMGLDRAEQRVGFVALCAVLMLLLELSQPSWWWGAACLWWGIAFAWVLDYPGSAKNWKDKHGVMAGIGVLVLLPAWHGLVFLHSQENGAGWVLYVMAIVWGADTGAYFAGRRYGNKKLAPEVSPGKSVAGLVGGALTTSILATVASFYVASSFYEGVGLVLLTVMVSLISVLGDLLESMMKRERGVKDSGQILPGHGGILDRIDSLTAASPVFTLGWYLSHY